MYKPVRVLLNTGAPVPTALNQASNKSLAIIACHWYPSQPNLSPICVGYDRFYCIMFFQFLALINKIIAYFNYQLTLFLTQNKDKIILNIYFASFMSYNATLRQLYDSFTLQRKASVQPVRQGIWSDLDKIKIWLDLGI